MNLASLATGSWRLLGACLLVLSVACASSAGAPARAPAAAPAPGTASEPAATSSAAAAPAPLIPVKIAYGAISGTAAPLWMAKDNGLFEAEGLDVELLYLQSSSQVAKSMVSGELGMAMTAGAGVVDANLAGADLVVVVGHNNYIHFRMFGGQGIERVEQLRDKRVGIGRFGSGIDMAARLILEKHGIVAGRETTLIQLGTEMDIIQATLGGVVEAGVLAFPMSFEAERLGLRLLDDTRQYRLPFISGSLTTSRAFMNANDDVVRRVVRAHTAAQGMYHCDPAAAKRSIANWSRLEDPEVLEKTYRVFAETFERVPVPPASGLQTVLDQRAPEVEAARTANAAEWVDDRYVRALESSGFIDQVYACGGTNSR